VIFKPQTRNERHGDERHGDERHGDALSRTPRVSFSEPITPQFSTLRFSSAGRGHL
jgi:hypothetical protein